MWLQFYPLSLCMWIFCVELLCFIYNIWPSRRLIQYLVHLCSDAYYCISLFCSGTYQLEIQVYNMFLSCTIMLLTFQPYIWTLDMFTGFIMWGWVIVLIHIIMTLVRGINIGMTTNQQSYCLHMKFMILVPEALFKCHLPFFQFYEHLFCFF